MAKVIITAIHEEARPLIEKIGLKKDPHAQRIPLYRRGDTCLVVSGTGKVKSAIATTFALANIESPENTIVINFGLCGCHDTQRPLGELVFINKITDAATKRDFYPEIILKHNLREASLTTFDNHVLKGRDPVSSDMVDMEASGFFPSASAFIPLENIYCLKLISDHLEDIKLDNPMIREKIETRMDALMGVINSGSKLNSRSTPIQGDDISILNQLCEVLKLTITQRHQLQDYATGYIIRHQKGLDLLHPYCKQTVKNKADRNRLFKKITHGLQSQ